MTEHVLYQTGDADAPAQILDRNGHVVLAMCRVCGAVESELIDANCSEVRERRAFEVATYARYQTMKAAGLLKPDDGDGSPEALFWKRPNGEYGVLIFNAAWWGWRAARGLV